MEIGYINYPHKKKTHKLRISHITKHSAIKTNKFKMKLQHFTHVKYPKFLDIHWNLNALLIFSKKHNAYCMNIGNYLFSIITSN